MSSAPQGRRDGWISLGMAVSATSAAVSSFSGLTALAEAAGWAPFMAPLLPLTVDAYAMTATRVWLSGTTSSVRARRFARSNAIGAILLSLAGNAAWHLVAADMLTPGWVIVVGVGSVPPVVLGLVAHLAALRRQEEPTTPVAGTVPGTVLSTASDSGAGPRYGSRDDLLAAARAAAAAHKAEHGKPITRDELRKALRIGGQRATEVYRALRRMDDGKDTAAA